MITVLLVDAIPAVRAGLRLVLSLESDMVVLGEAGNGRQAITLTQQLRPDVVVMDINLPDLDGLAATQALQLSDSRSAVVILTLHNNAHYREQAKAAGAAFFIIKQGDPQDLITAIRAAAASPTLDGVADRDKEGMANTGKGGCGRWVDARYC